MKTLGKTAETNQEKTRWRQINKIKQEATKHVKINKMARGTQRNPTPGQSLTTAMILAYVTATPSKTL